MDHLFCDLMSTAAPEIPLLSQPESYYDDGEWTKFPQRQGFTLDALKNTAFAAPHDAQKGALSVIQEWLFIGFASEFARIMRLPFDRDDVVRLDGDRKLASSTSLPSFALLLMKGQLDREAAGDLVAADTPMMPPTNEADLNRIQEIYGYSPNAKVALMRRVTSTEDSRQRINDMSETSFRFLESCLEVCRDPLPSDLSMEIWFSCFILCESLYHLSSYFGYRRAGRNIDLDHPYFIREAKKTGLCPTKLCPDELQVGDPISRTLQSITNLYLALKTPRKRLDVHSSCTVTSCEIPRSIQNLPQHRYPCSGDCEHIAADEAARVAIHDALDSGSYPVCKIKQRPEAGIDISWTAQNKCSLPYVAFSHVWSHGLGNDSENALPVCQLRFLDGLLKRRFKHGTDSESVFWLDTLCVPRESPRRTQAIRKMTDTYRDAQAVIVVDNDVLNGYGSLMQRDQTFAISDWMTRLWTYQEAFLAGAKLVVATGDDLLLRQQLALLDPTHKGLYQMVLATNRSSGISDPDFHVLHGENPSQDYTLLNSAISLHSRTTSKQQDEAICLATMLGVDIVDRLNPDRLDCPGSLEQLDLGHLFEDLKVMPENLIFAPGRRLRRQGLRALPSSFLARRTVPAMDTVCERHATLTSNGLKIRSTCYVVLQELSTKIVKEQSRFIKLVDEKDEFELWLFKYHEEDVTGGVSDDSTISHAGFVFSHAMSSIDGGGKNAAILMELGEREGDVIYSHWLARYGIVLPHLMENRRIPERCITTLKVRPIEEQLILLD